MAPESLLRDATGRACFSLGGLIPGPPGNLTCHSRNNTRRYLACQRDGSMRENGISYSLGLGSMITNSSSFCAVRDAAAAVVNTVQYELLLGVCAVGAILWLVVGMLKLMLPVFLLSPSAWMLS